MKRTFLATFLSIVFALVAVACHGSDEKEIGYTELPAQAQQFVKQYFPTATYSRVEKEKDNGNLMKLVVLSSSHTQYGGFARAYSRLSLSRAVSSANPRQPR